MFAKMQAKNMIRYRYQEFQQEDEESLIDSDIDAPALLIFTKKKKSVYFCVCHSIKKLDIPQNVNLRALGLHMEEQTLKLRPSIPKMYTNLAQSLCEENKACTQEYKHKTQRDVNWFAFKVYTLCTKLE